MLFLYFKAPFGAFRSFQSIEMSMTADFVTHSAAYGLLLGLAGVPRESKKDYAGARIALGLKGERLPLHGRAYQQLHWVKLEGRVEEPTTLDYWGLPFMGDNNFFVERLEVSDDPSPCRWFSLYQGEPLSRGARLHYLSVWTDYEADNESEPRSVSRSGSLPFALTD